MEVGLFEEVLRRLLRRHRFDRVCGVVAQDSRVDAVREPDVAEVRVGADPVVINCLIRGELERRTHDLVAHSDAQARNTYHERIPLSRENLDGIHGDGLRLNPVRLDDGEVMAVDAEDVVRVARQRDKAEAVPKEKVSAYLRVDVKNIVPFALRDVDDSEVSSGGGRAPSQAIDKSRVGPESIISDKFIVIYSERAGGTHGKLGPSLAAVWYQSVRVITVESIKSQ